MVIKRAVISLFVLTWKGVLKQLGNTMHSTTQLVGCDIDIYISVYRYIQRYIYIKYLIVYIKQSP